MVRSTKRRGQRVLVLDFWYSTPDGTRRRYRRDAEVQTHAAAHAELRRRLAAVAATGSPYAIVDETAAKVEAEQAPRTSAGPLFEEVVEGYWLTFAPSHLKASTCHTYRMVMNTHLLPRLAKKPLAEIDRVAVRELDATMVKAGASRTTRRLAQSVLRSVVCRHAVEAGLLKDPPPMPKMPKGSDKVPVIITAETAMQILKEAQRPEHRLALMLAFFAGLRTCEIRGLRVCDVDLVARMLRVQQAIVRGVTDSPKSGHGREVPLTDELHAVLAQAMQGRARTAFVAVSTRGARWGEGGLRNMFVRCAKRAGIEGSTTHHLRHGFVTTLLDRGVGAHIVQELAGHANLTTTQRYAHAVAKNKRVAIDVLNTLRPAA
jgi:integrase